MKTNIFWFRKDLRIDDNIGLYHALKAKLPVLAVYIFDKEVIDDLPKNDSGISFVYESLKNINKELQQHQSSIKILFGNPEKAFAKIFKEYNIDSVFANRDYEPEVQSNDEIIKIFLEKHSVKFRTFKDRVLFEPGEILKPDGKPYIVYTPYKNKCLQNLRKSEEKNFKIQKHDMNGFLKTSENFPSLQEIGFSNPAFTVRDYDLTVIKNYHKTRDYPYLDSGSYLGPHLRFGTVSIRKIAKIAMEHNEVFLSELFWREFFIQILYYFPHVQIGAFRKKYDYIEWRNNEEEFNKWSRGETGYPLVDAGMNELNTTGYMHNRVRMVAASFLVKHLLIDWRWGEAYFADKLLDYELASNNGNWQWVAGTGCDAAPYFRIFNPVLQQNKYDKNQIYIKKFLMEKTVNNKPLIVEHDFATKRAISAYRNNNLNEI